MKKKIIFCMIAFISIYIDEIHATCSGPSFAIEIINSSSVTAFQISANNSNRIAFTQANGNSQVLTTYIGSSVLETEACGVQVTTNICYMIRPLNWVTGNDILTLNVNSVNAWNSNLRFGFDPSTKQFSLINAGNTSLYSLNQCLNCASNVIIAPTTSFATPLTESSNWIASNEDTNGVNIIVDSSANVVLDADATSYVHLKSGLFSSPDNGSFHVVCFDGCGATNLSGTNISLGLYIQGYMADSNSMKAVLLNQGLNALATDVDVIRVNLRTDTSPYNLVASSDAMLTIQGDLVANFPPLTGSYYVEVMHRNSLKTWSASPVSVVPGALIPLDWKYSANSAYGSNQLEVFSGIYAIYSGDINQDENIDLGDLSLLENDIISFSSGYLNTDINGDGNIDILDSPITENNVSNFVFSAHP